MTERKGASRVDIERRAVLLPFFLGNIPILGYEVIGIEKTGINREDAARFIDINGSEIEYHGYRIKFVAVAHKERR